MLYEFVKQHRQKRIGERTKEGKEARWQRYIEPAWGDCPISLVTRRSAQEWVTELEDQIESGQAGTLGLAQLEGIRTDLHALFESLDSFSPDYEDRKNPFAGLEFTPRPPRAKVTIESSAFAAVHNACSTFASEGLCTPWIAEMFLTSLLAGLRQGETLALCADQLDFENGAITVDRSMRRKSRAIDPRTRLEVGGIERQAIHLPKGGTPSNTKTRTVPMTDQLAGILQKAVSRSRTNVSGWDLVWPGETGKLRELTRVNTAWQTLRKRLNELAVLAPLAHNGNRWPEPEGARGWQKNPLVAKARADASLRLPDIFGDIDYRDTRNSFASYMNEVGISQATREHLLGHGGGLTNTVYTVTTSAAFQDARTRLTQGWDML
ncbi:MAG: tyrosine-type recombinase/integrase [Fimbriimonadaceae bacterium]|nr:tyrosine-type recombinase/integrase [Fimbriimonadaceae bacterium]